MTDRERIDARAFRVSIPINLTANEFAELFSRWARGFDKLIAGSDWVGMAGNQWLEIDIGSTAALLDLAMQGAQRLDATFEHGDGTISAIPAPDALSHTGYDLRVATDAGQGFVVTLSGCEPFSPLVASVSGPVASVNEIARPLAQTMATLLEPEYVNVVELSARKALRKQIRPLVGLPDELAGTKWVRTSGPLSGLPADVQAEPSGDGYLLSIADGAPTSTDPTFASVVTATTTLNRAMQGDLDFKTAVTGHNRRPKINDVSFDDITDNGDLTWTLVTSKPITDQHIAVLSREAKRQSRAARTNSITWVISDQTALQPVNQAIHASETTNITASVHSYPPIMERLRLRLEPASNQGAQA